MNKKELEKTLLLTNALKCLDCGKCSANCHIAESKPKANPRMLMEEIIQNNKPATKNNPLLWDCTTCMMCSERCISDVNFIDVIRMLRKIEFEGGSAPDYTHTETIHSWMRIQAKNLSKKRRIDGITNKKIKILDKPDDVSETLFFGGCYPYYELFFEELNLKFTEAVNNSLNILLHIYNDNVGIMPDEKCCGHDLYWSGDTVNFNKLKDDNVERIKRHKPKRIITHCAECFRTLKYDYDLDNIEVLHISQVISANIDKIQLKKYSTKKVSYHDPCRLGRQSGIYDEPRKIIEAIPGSNFVELKKNKNLSTCCGTNAWINCTTHSKDMQEDKLNQTDCVGAKILATSCPKCIIHLKCAQKELEKENKKFNIDIVDIMNITVI